MSDKLPGSSPYNPIKYRGYEISMNWCNIDARCDYVFAHKDYDGAPIEPDGPPSDSRCGYGPSIDDCKSQIDDLVELDGIVTTGA